MAKKSSSSNSTSKQVFDFIYVDVGRIERLVAQMDELGVLTSLSQEHSKGKQSSGEQSGKIGGTLGVVSGESSDKMEIANTFGKSMVRSFDGRHALPISFLNMLAEEGMIEADPSNWRSGSIGQITGGVTIANMEVLTRLTSSSVIGALDDEIENAAVAFELLGKSAARVQAVVLKGGTRAWGIYDVDNWVMDPDALSAYHGSKLTGQWTMIGIVEALPGENSAPNFEHFGEAMQSLAKFTELSTQLIGRKSSCHGVTPLLLFRQVS